MSAIPADISSDGPYKISHQLS